MVWTNTYGMARSLLAFGTLSTLVINSNDILFKPSFQGISYCDSIGISLYCIFENLLFGKLISIFILMLVVVGWRPLITGILHWWVMYSFINSAIILDGGDHIASIITLLLIPITLTDNRKWHWAKYEVRKPTKTWVGIKSIIALSSILAIKVQVSVIYLNSAAAKLSVKEWTDGTAIYYWFNHPIFGYPHWLGGIIEPVILNGTTLFIISWGTILFEFVLFAGLFMDNRFKRAFLALGLLFHFGIFIIHGLASFFFTMSACLIIFLGPTYKGISYPRTMVNLKTKVYDAIFYLRSRIAHNRPIA